MSRRYCFAFAFAAAAWLGTAHAATTCDMKVLSRLPLAGPVSWDYLSFDPAHRRLFVSRGDRVQAVDVDNQRLVATIPDTPGVHGIALAPSLHRGYTSNGKGNAVTVFDLDTLAVTDTIKGTGEKPDAIVYDDASGHVLTFNGNGHSVSVIDPARHAVIGTIALSGKPEFAATDGAGHAYVNIEDRAELVEIDTRKNAVLGTWPLPGCESPTGLALDRAHRRLFSVCDNRHMVVTDAGTGHQVASLPIGDGPDAVVYDEGKGMIYSSNGESGNITAIRQDDPDHYRVAATIPTQHSARTLALDPKLHRLYLSAASLDPAGGANQKGRNYLPGSFSVLTVGCP